MTEWLFAQNILAPNIRDLFSAKGKMPIKKVGSDPLPRIYATFNSCQTQFHIAIERTPEIILKHYWGKNYSGVIPPVTTDRIKLWLNLVCIQHGGEDEKISDTTYKFRETLEKILGV